MPIITMDVEGAHNRNPNAASRILKSGSWKRQRTIMLLPTSELMPARAALSMMNMFAPPNQAFIRYLCLDMEVGEAYSQAIEDILNNPDLSQWEYILTVEHDNMVPADGLVRLCERMEAHKELSCISGLYWCKGEGGPPQIWGDAKDMMPNYRPQPPVPGQVVECWGVGMGFALWRLSMFKDGRLRRPWFKTLRGSEGQGVGTQDLYFWADARKYGYRCGVDCDCKVGHLDYKGEFGPKGMVW